ncbi:hypothetical protein V2I01_12845 [Micromonospora sp. BRA006-A]|nr:hypothetical protein [Micromonospora sp. BRA006-A]
MIDSESPGCSISQPLTKVRRFFMTVVAEVPECRVTRWTIQSLGELNATDRVAISPSASVGDSFTQREAMNSRDQSPSTFPYSS